MTSLPKYQPERSTATFTMSLQEAFELTGGSVAIGSNGVSVLTGGDIGLQYYPIWEESYRPTLNGKIYDHFLLREIGFETIDLFRQRMRSHMNDIMPYYNQLFKTQLDMIDPLRTINLSTITDGNFNQQVTAENETGAVSSNTTGSRAINSDFPQNMLNGNSDYASSGADVNGKTTVESNATESNESESDSTQHTENQVTGYQGIPGDIVTSLRQAIVNIDLSIMDAMEPMFMQVFNNGDSYTQRGYYYGYYPY